jgi:tight adherence protein C
MIYLLFFLLAGATLTVLLWNAAEMVQPEEDPLGDRLDELQSQALVSAQRAARRKSTGRGVDRFLDVIGKMPQGAEWLHNSERLLHRAGFRRKYALVVHVVLTLLFVLLLTSLMWWVERNNPVTSKLIGVMVALLLGFLLPNIVLERLVKRYRRKLQEALPDTVDLLGIVLGTGLALDQAMMRVSEEMQYIYPALADEFGTVVMQVRAGQERTTAFQQLVRRTGLEDIKSLAAMIVQSEKFGTSLAQALKVYADALRTRRRLAAEAAVGKAGIKMLFPIVIFILPVLFIITLVPGLLSVLQDLKILGSPR